MFRPVLGDAAAYRQLQQAFVDWVRQRVTTDDLFAAVATHKKSIPGRYSDFAKQIELLEYCRGVADETAADLAAGGQRDLLDPAVTSIYCLCVSFRESLGQFRLVHDASKVIDRHATTLRDAHLLPAQRPAGSGARPWVHPGVREEPSTFGAPGRDTPVPRACGDDPIREVRGWLAFICSLCTRGCPPRVA